MDRLPYLAADPYSQYARLNSESVSMRRLGRIILEQEVLAQFFRTLPTSMWVVDATMMPYSYSPAPIEFVLDWDGFDPVPKGSRIPLYKPNFHIGGFTTFEHEKE